MSLFRRLSFRASVCTAAVSLCLSRRSFLSGFVPIRRSAPSLRFVRHNYPLFQWFRHSWGRVSAASSHPLPQVEPVVHVELALVLCKLQRELLRHLLCGLLLLLGRWSISSSIFSIGTFFSGLLKICVCVCAYVCVWGGGGVWAVSGL